MPASQTKIVIILTAVLLAVVAASVGLLLLLPGSTTPDASLLTPSPAFTPIIPAASGGSFNFSVFQQAAFQSLDLRLVADGSLPVQPPAGTGKANPFL